MAHFPTSKHSRAVEDTPCPLTTSYVRRRGTSSVKQKDAPLPLPTYSACIKFKLNNYLNVTIKKQEITSTNRNYMWKSWWRITLLENKNIFLKLSYEYRVWQWRNLILLIYSFHIYVACIRCQELEMQPWPKPTRLWPSKVYIPPY